MKHSWPTPTFWNKNWSQHETKMYYENINEYFDFFSCVKVRSFSLLSTKTTVHRLSLIQVLIYITIQYHIFMLNSVFALHTSSERFFCCCCFFKKALYTPISSRSTVSSSGHLVENFKKRTVLKIFNLSQPVQLINLYPKW